MINVTSKNSLIYLFKAIILTTIIVSILGYIDFKTGEISLDVLYLLCVCLVTWYTNTLLGMFCIIEIFFAKVSADYFCHIKVGTYIYEWNAISYIIIYIIVCVMVGKLKKILTE
jgi:hypothetical protein